MIVIELVTVLSVLIGWLIALVGFCYIVAYMWSKVFFWLCIKADGVVKYFLN